MDLKLAKLPDRTPVKLAITVTPQLACRLGLYAELYAARYGSEETIAELIPYMLESFLDGDRDFLKAFKDREANGGVQSLSPQITRRKRRTKADEPQPASEE